MTDPPAWMTDAACRAGDPAAFYPEKGGSVAPARAICASCPVTDTCRDYAVTHSIAFGVWGGTTGRQRRQLALARGLAWEPWSVWSPSGLGLFAGTPRMPYVGVICDGQRGRTQHERHRLPPVRPRTPPRRRTVARR